MSITFEEASKAAYAADQFLNREELIDLVQQKVTRLSQELGTVNYPLLNFWGGVGSGKTWLLKHLNLLFKTQTSYQSCVVYLDIAQFDLSHPKKSEQLVGQIAQQLIDQLPAEAKSIYGEQLQHVAISKQWGDLVFALQTIAEQRCIPILLFDHLDQKEHRWWEIIEEQLIEPLLTSCQLLVITASRHPMLSSLQPELLRRQESLRLTQVMPLSAAYVAQLTTFSAAHTHWRYSGGNAWLATQLTTIERLDASELTTTYRNFLAHLFQSIPNNLIVYLEIVGVLRYFREAALSHMLKETGHLIPNKVKLGRILRQLAQNGDIVWWDKERAQYVSSTTIRVVLTQYQLLRNPKQHLQSQEQAIEFYWQRLQKFEDIRVIGEIIYHQMWIVIADHDPPREAELWQVIKALDIPAQDRIRTAVLADEEIKSLVTEQLYQTLVNRFNELSD